MNSGKWFLISLNSGKTIYSAYDKSRVIEYQRDRGYVSTTYIEQVKQDLPEEDDEDTYV